MGKIDFVNNKNYYRDILKKYSISEILYLDNMKIDERKAIVSILLSLKIKKKIDIMDNKIVIIDSNTSDLKYTEKYIFEHITNDMVVLDVDGYTKFYTIKELKEDNLIIEDKLTVKKFLKKSIIPLLLTLLFVIAFIIILINYNSLAENSGNILVILVAFFDLIIFDIPTILIIYFLVYTFKKADSYNRTNLDEEINIKIEGLKNYMSDFGNFSEKDKEELILWEDYLIYSVMFDLNSKIYYDLVKYIDIRLEHGKVYM